jgi:hypothetical protein
VIKRTAFIVPSAPVLKRVPPSGPEWLHEVKHDGWRAQLHRHDAGATILSKTHCPFGIAAQLSDRDCGRKLDGKARAASDGVGTGGDLTVELPGQQRHERHAEPA